MSGEVKNQNSLSEEFDGKGRGVLKSIYDFVSSLIMGLMGIVTYCACLFTVFRHGSGIAEISIIEVGLFIWLAYCVGVSKDLAVEQSRSVFVFRWRVFTLTGWTMFWTTLAFIAWFEWGADDGFQEDFLATNFFEMSLLLVVGLGSGFGVLTSVEFEKETVLVDDVKGETV